MTKFLNILKVIIFFLFSIIINILMKLQNLNFISFSDAAYAEQFGIQDPASLSAAGMIFFHNTLISYLLLIAVVVFWLLFQALNNQGQNKSIQFAHSSILEFGWTVLPAFFLGLIALPSFSLLYSLEDVLRKPYITLKVVGHQWYWTYEYSSLNLLSLAAFLDHHNFKFDNENILTIMPSYDSYMISNNDLEPGNFRTLDVDKSIFLPVGRLIRLYVTSADVLHSFAIPSFGIKIDACPGRLSQGSLFIKRKGIFYGQCSEICGINHALMPIIVKSINEIHFLFFYKNLSKV